MAQYMCGPCGWIYDEEHGDPEHGIAPGTKFEDIPDDWKCPECGVGKEDFYLLDFVIQRQPHPQGKPRRPAFRLRRQGTPFYPFTPAKPCCTDATRLFPFYRQNVNFRQKTSKITPSPPHLRKKA